MGYKVNIKRIIQRFGGRIPLFKKLAVRGRLVPTRTLDKWIENGFLPLQKLLLLMELAAEEGWKIDLYEEVRELKLKKTKTNASTKANTAAEGCVPAEALPVGNHQAPQQDCVA